MTPEMARTGCHVLAAVGGIVAALGVLGSNHFNQKVDAKRQEAAGRDRAELTGKIDRLLTGNSELQKQLEPFKKIAETKFPGLPEDEGLKKVQQSLQQLEQRTDAIQSAVRLRDIPDDIFVQLATELRTFPNIKVRLIHNAGDPEIANLVERLRLLFAQANWKIDQDASDLAGTRRPGIRLFGSSEQPSLAISTLYHGLDAAQIKPGLFLDRNLPPDVIGIEIGRK